MCWGLVGDDIDRWRHRKVLSDHLSNATCESRPSNVGKLSHISGYPRYFRSAAGHCFWELNKLGFTIYGEKFSSISVAVMINDNYSFFNDINYLPFEGILLNFQLRWNTLLSFNYKIALLSCNKFCEPILAVTDSMLIIQALQHFFLLALQFRVSNRTIRFARTTVPRPNISTPPTTVTGWRRPMVRRTMDP